MKASLTISARDQASSVFTRIAARAKAMGAAFKPVAREANAADRAIESIGKSAPARFARIAAAAKALAGTYGLKAIEKSAYGAGRGVGFLLRKGAGFAAGAAAWGGAAVAGGLGLAFTKMIAVGAQFELFQAQLEGTEGSADKAKQALDWVKKFAAETPYEVDQVTDAFVRARGALIDPFGGGMRSMGDAASGARKTIMEAVEAVNDAQTQQYERLKAFNITASTKGNKVGFSFVDKDGKSQLVTVKKDMKTIQEAVLKIFDAKYAGAMIRQSKTLVGIWSNIKDTATNFLLSIAQAGIFDLIKAKASALLVKFQQWGKDGSIQKWAKEISTWLEKAVSWGSDFVKGVDWAHLGQDIGGAAKAVWTLVKALAWVARLVSSVDWSGWAKNMPVLGNVVKLAGGALDVVDWATSGSAAPSKARPRPAPAAPYKAFHPVPTGRARINSPVRGGMKVGGALDIRIKTDPGTSARVTKLSSNSRDVPIKVANRGAVSFG